MSEIEFKIRKAIQDKNQEELDSAIDDILDKTDCSNYVDILNELLLVPFHYKHQYIARAIQDLKTPSSVPYIRKILESEFKGIPYNGSDSYGMAKWFSWALYEIGTKEAIDLMKEFANSTDEGIRYEMNYRLNKLK